MFIFARDSRGKNTNLIRKKTASDFGEFTDKALASFNNLGSSAAAAAWKFLAWWIWGILPLQSWDVPRGAKLYR